MKYVLSDFKDLVERWYNEFLPSIAEDKSVFLEDSGIVYIKPMVSLEPRKMDTIKFFVGNALKTKIEKNDIPIVIREPLPVNNIGLRSFLKEVEHSKLIDDENTNKIFHLANHRYFVNSSDILVSQWKEIDIFLNQIFDALSSNLKTNGIKFYSSQSLGINDSLDVFSSFFPRNSIIQANPYVGKTLLICPTSEILFNLSKRIGICSTNVKSQPPKFMEQAKESMLSEIETLI